MLLICESDVCQTGFNFYSYSTHISRVVTIIRNFDSTFIWTPESDVSQTGYYVDSLLSSYSSLIYPETLKPDFSLLWGCIPRPLLSHQTHFDLIYSRNYWVSLVCKSTICDRYNHTPIYKRYIFTPTRSRSIYSWFHLRKISRLLFRDFSIFNARFVWLIFK